MIHSIVIITTKLREKEGSIGLNQKIILSPNHKNSPLSVEVVVFYFSNPNKGRYYIALLVTLK